MEDVSEGPTHRFAGVGNVLVSVYWAAPTVDVLQTRIEWVERTIQRYPNFGLLVVVTECSTGGLPDRAFREESRAQAERYKDHLAFSGTVIEGDEVMPTLVRTFLRGLRVVVGRRVNVRFFDEVPEGAAWVGERSEDAPSRALEDAVRALRPD